MGRIFRVCDLRRLEGYGRTTARAGADGFGEFYYTQTKLPKDIDPLEAVVIITFREVLAATKKFGFAANKSLVVFGAGPVGLL